MKTYKVTIELSVEASSPRFAYSEAVDVVTDYDWSSIRIFDEESGEEVLGEENLTYYDDFHHSRTEEER